MTDEVILAQTKKWIIDVVVGCNFCPFAGREVKRGSIHYEVIHSPDQKQVLEALASSFMALDNDPSKETLLLILVKGFQHFQHYLDIVEIAESFLQEEGYEGVYQIASFHPQYLFDQTNEDDPSNFTNRSPYPMLHILREASLTSAIDSHPDPGSIPLQNIAFTKAKGLQYMQLLRDACMNI